jgi:hypothetical protein
MEEASQRETSVTMMILLQQNKKRREPEGQKMSLEGTGHSFHQKSS